MKLLLAVLAVLFSLAPTQAQNLNALADSLRQRYRIPELAYAVVSSDTVYELRVLGVRKIGTDLRAAPTDPFRIGSNTKAVTGYIAALLVKRGKLRWNTTFFDLYPELRAKSRKAYHSLTLLDLLTFRAPLPPYTYTNDKPTRDQFSGTPPQQRYQFAAWFFRQKPVTDTNSLHFSNLGYVAAGLMLEKASGRSYPQLVAELGAELGIHLGFGNPNALDGRQTWGHDAELTPEPPGDNYKLDWLLAAGNLHASLPDYVRFIQAQLKGLSGKSTLLTKEDFHFLHYGLPQFAVGWFWQVDENNHRVSNNTGNPGTFLTKVYVFGDLDRAFVLFSNAQTADAEKGLDALYAELRKRYGR